MILPLAVYNVFWTAPALWDIIRGRFKVALIYPLYVLLTAFVFTGFQIAALIGFEEVGSGPVSLALVIICMFSQIMGVLGHKAAIWMKAEKFLFLHEKGNFEAALAAAHLNAVAPNLARHMIEMSRKKTAAILAGTETDWPDEEIPDA